MIFYRCLPRVLAGGHVFAVLGLYGARLHLWGFLGLWFAEIYTGSQISIVTACWSGPHGGSLFSFANPESPRWEISCSAERPIPSSNDQMETITMETVWTQRGGGGGYICGVRGLQSRGTQDWALPGSLWQKSVLLFPGRSFHSQM